ncbi:MAG: hypothetical protein M1834_003059 [Cirrosporium novae-zelandiae]|nr:MAG: hypothetical protein M1834_003059 [Cirrosporium novae-zelandiae]
MDLLFTFRQSSRHMCVNASEGQLVPRKVEGVKLGTVVSRDLKKRIPPGSSAKAAFRDPFLELDVSKKNITDEGFLHLAQGLKEAFEYNGEQGKVIHLEELCLADNKISVISLDPLADIIKLAGDELEDLDLSGNEIKIESDQDGEIWERFLESFKFCSVLRRVDFSGSPLGPKAFEILARVYSKAETVDGFSSEGTSGEGNVEVITSDLDSTEAVAIEIPTARRHRGQETTMARYSSTRGIRSIPYMIFADTFMTDTCALHLSYIIAAHYPPHKLLRYVPPAKAGQPAQILDNYFQSGCLGIIYLPNANLSNNGQKLLDLAEQARVDEHEYSSIPESSQEAQPFPRSSRKGSGAGSHTDSNGSASGDSLETGRRRSNTSADPESPSTPYHAYIQNVSGELDRLRIRVQGLTLKEFGPESVELWRCGLKMLRLARTILLEGQRVEPEPEPQAPVLRIGPPKQTYASKLVASDATNKHPGEPIFGMVETSPRPRSPYTFTLAKGNNTSSASPSPTTLHSTRIKSDKRPLLLGFPLELWCQILAHAADAIGTISKEQQIGIVEWARDRESLGREMESLGKLESAQIWRVLDGMGCLAYDIRR